jgi:peptidoglycan/LPS O-acetylase OafA/YrhL
MMTLTEEAKSSDSNKASRHLLPLDGLRGLLALWVVAFHSLSIPGLYGLVPSRLQSMLDGGQAVAGFIILSGFVITRLLLLKRESYPVFIARRFLRLFPTFALAIGLALLIQRVGAMPTNLPAGETWAYLLSHVTMLFGALPSFWPGSGSAILNPAWSISLEWQFYLIAPLFAMLLRRQLGGFVAVSVICLVAARFIGPMLSDHGFAFGFLPSYLQLFWAGIASYLLYDWSLRNEVAGRFAATALLFAALLFLPYAPNSGSIVWLLVFAAIVVSPRIANKWLGGRWVVYLGAISYPLYLLHEPIVWFLLPYLRDVAGGISLALILFAATCLIVIPLSALTHRFIEQPVIAWGKKLGASPVG